MTDGKLKQFRLRRGKTVAGRAGRKGAKTLLLIQRSFSGHDQLIEGIFRDSRPFRDLCADYRNCAAALHRWETLDTPNAETRRQEYAELLQELQNEIHSWLNARDTLSPMED